MVKQIKNKRLQKALEVVDLGDIQLWKSDDYFFIDSDSKVWKDRISALYSDSILRSTFTEASVEDWVRDIINTLTDSTQRCLEDWQIELRNNLEGIV